MFTLKAVETISRDRAKAGHEAAFAAFVSHAALALFASADRDAKALRSYMDKHLWECAYDSGQKSRYLTATLAFAGLVKRKFPEHKRIVSANAETDATGYFDHVHGLFTDHGANNVSKALHFAKSDGAAVTKSAWQAMRGENPAKAASTAPKASALDATKSVDAPQSGPPANPETPAAPPAPKSAKEREAEALQEALAAVRKLATGRALAQVMRAVQERQQDIAKAATPKVKATDETGQDLAKAA